MNSPHEDLGYRRPDPRSQRPSPAPRAPRPQPRIDPDILNAPRENDFTRWYAEHCRAEGKPNILERNRP